MISNLTISMPRVAAVAVSTLAVSFVTLSGGVGAGVISALFTALCVSPLFTSIHVVDTGSVSESTASHIFAETNLDELQLFREEEHSIVGRMIHQTIEFCNLDELVFVFCLLRENRGLLILLIGGVTSMMMALLAGLEDVNMVRAFSLSISCYSITTVLVARSARTIAYGNSTQSKEDKLSRTDLKHIMESIPTESFVSGNEMEHYDTRLLLKMLGNRSDESVQHCKTGVTKQNLMNVLSRKRNYNDDCCICLTAFEKGQTIRVLPRCHHEFHKCCIDRWALTFATKQYEFNTTCRKRGRPTCPLCNRILETLDQSTCISHSKG